MDDCIDDFIGDEHSQLIEPDKSNSVGLLSFSLKRTHPFRLKINRNIKKVEKSMGYEVEDVEEFCAGPRNLKLGEQKRVRREQVRQNIRKRT